MGQLSAEARKVLVEAYVALRRGDALPGSQVAYRITVRQLEGLVRLSEAIARCHLSSEVSPNQWPFLYIAIYSILVEAGVHLVT